MAYHLTLLSPQLVFIQPDAEPTREDDRVYLAEVRRLLDEASSPIYFLVDFRQYMTTNVSTINKLAQLSTHENFGGSVAFSSDRSRAVYTGLYASLSGVEGPRTLSDDSYTAIGQLEALSPGVTQGIEWEKVLG
jgi:hypothetical protein